MCFTIRGGDQRIVDVEDQVVADRARPVEAQHLVQVLALGAHRVLRSDVHLDLDSAVGVKALQGARKAVHRRFHGAVRPGCGSRCSGPSLREVIVHLATHPFDLLPDGRREVVVTRLRDGVGLLPQHRQRSLQAVGEIARLGHRAADPLFPVVEERVQVVHHRLQLERIVAFEPALLASAERRQPLAEAVKRRQARAHLPETQHDEDEGQDQHGVMGDPEHDRVVVDEGHGKKMGDRQQARDAQRRSQEQVRPEGAGGNHGSPGTR
jgi:hypothetical protein